MHLWCMQRVISPAEYESIIKSNLVVGIGRYPFCVTLSTTEGKNKRARNIEDCQNTDLRLGSESLCGEPYTK